MDKNTLTGFVLIGAVLIGFSLWNKPSEEQLAQQRHYNDSIAALQQQNDSINSILQEQEHKRALQALQTDSTSAVFGLTQGETHYLTLKNELLTVTLSSKGAHIVEATLANYQDQQGKPLTLFAEDETVFDMLFDGKNENLRTKDLYFTPTEVSDTKLTMNLQTHTGGRLEVSYELLPQSYVLGMSIRAIDMDNFFPATTKNMSLNWKQQARQHEKGFDFEQRYTSLTYMEAGEGTDYLSEGRDKQAQMEKPLEWIAYKGQFFSTVLIGKQTLNAAYLQSKLQEKGSGYLKSYESEFSTTFDPTGQEPTRFQWYLGPNHFGTLKAANKLCFRGGDTDLQDLVYLGWPVVNWINRWFTIPLFDWLKHWGLSMGIVLLLMTIIVKLIVFPATYKSYLASAKMRVLKPYVDELGKKYPDADDAMKKQQETMQLYGQYGVSPMGGCLPMLIQMPVFMALFFFVPNAIELRQQSFLWAPDLSAYDDIISWGTNIWLIGDHLSLFCLLFCVSSLLNSWITMKQQDTGANPQMKSMQYMTMLMPVMFIFIFNNYSSGLNYYYFISGFISILTMIVLRKSTDEAALLAKLEANKKKIATQRATRGTAQGGMMAKLAALQQEQERIRAEREKKHKH